MLPKFANHLFHHTARAATTVQNYALRNVIGYQSPSSSANGLGGWNGAGSSSWGGHGAGAGGAKYNTGSRFYSSQNGAAGRAVTQANSSTAGDSSSGQNDESDENSPRRILRIANRKARLRSSSLSSTTYRRSELVEPLDATKPVALIQTRAQHTQSGLPLLSAQNSSVTDAVKEQILDATPSQLTRARRNSTSAATSSTSDLAFDSPPPPSSADQPPQDLYEVSYTDPAAPQTTLPPNISSTPSSEQSFNVGKENNSGNKSEIYKRLSKALSSNDAKAVNAEVARFRLYKEQPDRAQFNIAIRALLETRSAGTPINKILETYNEMIAHGILPDFDTYQRLITALCVREREVTQVISQLNYNIRRRSLLGLKERANHPVDKEHIQELRDEKNLASAMIIFQAMVHLRPISSLGHQVYGYLLRACADNANINAAIRVFGHLEAATDIRPNATCYLHLLTTFANANDMKGAKDVFDEFRKAAVEGRVGVDGEDGDHSMYSSVVKNGKFVPSRRAKAQLLIWNNMIRGYFQAKQPDKAIELFDETLNSSAGAGFSLLDVPPPSSIMYRTIIRGFMSLNDPQTAIAWFEKMLAQETPAPRDPLQPLEAPIRPDDPMWFSFLEGLAEHNMVPEMNNYIVKMSSLPENDGTGFRPTLRLLILEANLKYLISVKDSISNERAGEIAQILVKHSLIFSGEDGLEITHESINTSIERILVVLTNYNLHDVVLELLSRYVEAVKNQMAATGTPEKKIDQDSYLPLKRTRTLVMSLIPVLLFRQNSNAPQLSLDFALSFAELCDSIGLSLTTAQVSVYYMHAYYTAKAESHPLNLSHAHWNYLAYSAAGVAAPNQHDSDQKSYISPPGFQFEGVPSFLQDFTEHGIKPSDISAKAAQRLVSAMRLTMDEAELEEYIKKLGNGWESVYEEVTRYYQMYKEQNVAVQTANDIRRPHPNHIDLYHGRYVDEHTRNTGVSLNVAYGRYQEGTENGVYPPPEVIGRMITAFGRAGDRDKVESLYRDAQMVLDALGEEKRWQSFGWFTIENHMIIAYSWLGDIDAAHVHRQRILANGGAPNAEAYASLINNLKDSTDDNERAMQLWNEARSNGVLPTLYLYNTIISQLSRARKAELALDMFREMKENQIYPSSVTYGALIAACSRVGDVQSAEVLFKEMTTQINFKPRVPPFNTMIQMFTSVKPDREKALHYFNELLSAKIQPTAHTYKLLLDIYGSIQPIDLSAMQKVFDDVVNDPNVAVQGTHWAVIINAWGCVQKDLEKAIEIFETIKDHPSSQTSAFPLPDVLSLEALINALVVHRRMDLAESYVNKMSQSGVHITAYVANLLIKGYAAVDRIDLSRQVFDGLVDPLAGVAAPYNHGTHGSHVPQKPYTISDGSSVYREPSTWEAMLRAELGSGNRNKALELLERLKSRQYPVAVYNRISSIMFGDGTMPWSTDDATSSASNSQSTSPSLDTGSTNTSLSSPPPEEALKV